MTKAKYFFLLLLTFVGWTGTGKAAEKDLLYFVDVCRFYATDDRPYAEIYLNIEGPTAYYSQTEAGTFEATIELKYDIRKADASEAEYAREMNLASPELPDTNAATLQFGFMDVRRVMLDPGTYILTGELRDINDPNKRTHKFERELLIEPKPMLTSMSDVEFIQYFRKSSEASTPISKLGYEIMPLISNASFMDADSVKFYTELYNATKESDQFLFVNTYLTKANSTEKLAGYQKTIKKSVRDLDIITGGFDISKLPSQTYYLNIDIYNNANKVIANTAEKIFVYNSQVQVDPVLASAEVEGDFSQHFNLDEKELDYYIPTLQYISTPTELDFAKGLRTLEEKQNYFYNFWRKRQPESASHIAAEWKNYKARVAYANDHYKSVYQPGWRTARGRVILTYGPPNDLEQHFYENDSYPYEIWRYNKIGTQANVIFVFYDPDRATEDWPLLHSDKLGENNNPRWRLDLIQRSVHEGNLDRNNPGSFMQPGRR